jgi:hypothetical protein
VGDREGEWVLYDRRSRRRRITAWILGVVGGAALALAAWHAA